MRTRHSVLALAVAGSLLFSACTSDDEPDADTDPTTTVAGGVTTTVAGGGGGTTAPTTAAPGGGVAPGATLAAVQAADTLKCGTRNDLPGFAVTDTAGGHVGFDIDFCMVIAAAVLGDAAKVTYVDVATADRFTALQSGQIDVLVRNTTWTASRDGAEGATFLQPNFYDGQGMMVRADADIEDLEGLEGGTICSAGGTTSEGNIATEFTRLGLTVPEVLSFESLELLQQAFQAGRCDGWSSDRSQLTGVRSTYPDGPESLVILPGTFSKEPLAPAVRDGDSQWAQVVNWAVLSTIQAEEFGLTQDNVDDELASTTDVSVQRFLGQAIDGSVTDPKLGLPGDFAYQVVKQVGNYGEIYDRHIEPLGLERGPNALWTDGGLLYSPPYR